MNPRAIPRKTALLLSALLLPLAACDNSLPPPPGPPPLEGATLGGDFELVNGAGETVRWTDFDGKYRIMYFGFTNCPAICPTDVQVIMRGYQAFAEQQPELAAKVQPVFVTVDPARDGPGEVAQFAAAFGEPLIGLTGSEEQIAAAAQAFGVSYAAMEPNEDGWYDMQHARYTVLYGPQGAPIAMLPADDSAEAVTAELMNWVR